MIYCMVLISISPCIRFMFPPRLCILPSFLTFVFFLFRFPPFIFVVCLVLLLCSRLSFVDVPLTFFCPADRVPDWQPRTPLLGMVEARPVNNVNTHTHTNTFGIARIHCSTNNSGCGKIEAHDNRSRVIIERQHSRLAPARVTQLTRD